MTLENFERLTDLLAAANHSSCHPEGLSSVNDCWVLITQKTKQRDVGHPALVLKIQSVFQFPLSPQRGCLVDSGPL